MEIVSDLPFITALAIDSLNKKRPLFDYQKTILKDLLSSKDRKRIVMLNCGRKFSKTYICSYFLWRKALETPNATFYYVAPTAEQGKEIIWQRLKNFGPTLIEAQGRKYRILSNAKDSSLELLFFNGARIKLVGSTGSSAESLRGCEPHGAVYDEFKDHDPRFHESMSPNYAVYDAPLLIIGTPPKMEEIESGEKKFYKEMMEYCERFDDCIVYSRPSTDNPIPSIHSWINNEILRLEGLGKSGRAIADREFRGLLVYGGTLDFMPQFSKSDLVSSATIEKAIHETASDFRFAAILDPGGGTRWGALFVAVDTGRGSMYVLDKITLRADREQDAEYMTHVRLFELVLKKIENLSPKNISIKNWTVFYDSANADFALNVKPSFRDIVLHPVNKNKFGKMEGFSQLKDLKEAGRLFISAKAEELIVEFQAIKLDSKGLPAKGFDELTDCMRYAIYEFNYLLNVELVPEEKTPSGYFDKKVAEHRKSLEDAWHPFEDFDDEIIDF